MNHPKILPLIILISAIATLIILSVIKIDLENHDAYLCSIISQTPSQNNLPCPSHKSNINWYVDITHITTTIIIILSIISLITPAKPTNGTSNKTNHKPTDLSTLDEEEKRIHDILTLSHGSMYQSDLIKKTDYSKVQITRVLDKMEGKGILERKRRGMTNIVILK